MKRIKIGFVGQGFVGRAYADDFERRGFLVTRYSLERPYRKNKGHIAECDIVFIAVPTPTTPQGFISTIVREALGLVGKGKVAVIKSTVLPGTTAEIQKDFPDRIVFHSPEFLTQRTATHDAAHPDRNIIGIPMKNREYIKKAKEVLNLLPKAPYKLICTSEEAELIKYGGNSWFYIKIVYINMLYDLAEKIGANWKVIEEGMAHDTRIGSTHLHPIHQGGRGAGGACFIKDFEAFRQMYNKYIGDEKGAKILESLIEKNNSYLRLSKKDLDLLGSVYGA